MLVVVVARKGTWGGRRPGAGRPREVQDPFRLTFDMEREDADALEAIARETGRSLASLVRESVERFIRSHRRKKVR